jgi:hypothetical protein
MLDGSKGSTTAYLPEVICSQSTFPNNLWSGRCETEAELEKAAEGLAWRGKHTEKALERVKKFIFLSVVISVAQTHT